jgi:hypothetical protein
MRRRRIERFIQAEVARIIDAETSHHVPAGAATAGVIQRGHPAPER